VPPLGSAAVAGTLRITHYRNTSSAGHVATASLFKHVHAPLPARAGYVVRGCVWGPSQRRGLAYWRLCCHDCPQNGAPLVACTGARWLARSVAECAAMSPPSSASSECARGGCTFLAKRQQGSRPYWDSRLLGRRLGPVAILNRQAVLQRPPRALQAPGQAGAGCCAADVQLQAVGAPGGCPPALLPGSCSDECSAAGAPGAPQLRNTL
jgi:hypothetical protein